MLHVSLTIAQDWDTESANPVITSLFDTIELDCYGREADTHQKVRILRGTTKYGLAIFCEALDQEVDSEEDITHLTFSHTR